MIHLNVLGQGGSCEVQESVSGPESLSLCSETGVFVSPLMLIPWTGFRLDGWGVQSDERQRSRFL